MLRRVLLLLSLLVFSLVIGLWLRYWMTAEDDGIPGPDKILGSLLTHVVLPERREHVTVPESDPNILVSLKTTTIYHRHRLSLLLFTWMTTLYPHQVRYTIDGYTITYVINNILFSVDQIFKIIQVAPTIGQHHNNILQNQ